MKVGDLVRYRTGHLFERHLGCLPFDHDDDPRWKTCGLVHEVRDNDSNVSVLWPKRGLELVDNYFLEVVNESR